MSKDYIDIANDWFDSNLNNLLQEHRGKWAVVFQSRLIGVYDSFSEAYKDGVVRANSEEILVRQIVEKDDKAAEISVNVTLGFMDAEPAIAGSS